MVEEFVRVGNEEASSIIHSFERAPDVNMRLSFLRLRRRTQRISESKWKYGKYRYRKSLLRQESDVADTVPREIRTEIYRRR